MPRAAGQFGQISDAAQAGAEDRRGPCPSRSTAARNGSRNIRAAWSPAAPCSRNWASITSGRSTAMTSTRWSRCSKMSATPTTGRCSSMSSPRRARAMARPRNRADKYHGVVKFDVVSGKQDKGPGGGPPSYTAVFADALIGGDGARREGRRDHRGDAVGHRARQVRSRPSPSAPSTSASPSSMR